jgi:hypothetical protein
VRSLIACCLLGLLFDPEDEDSKFYDTRGPLSKFKYGGKEIKKLTCKYRGEMKQVRIYRT